MKRYTIIGFFIILFLGHSQVIFAHPHSFIELKTQFHDDGENINAVTMQWRLDTIASSSVLYDLLNKQADDPEWEEQARLMMDNVIINHYFSEIYRNDKQIQLDNTATNYQLIRDDLQVILSFTVNFKQAQPIASSNYQLITFEPTFYVDMTYPYTSDITLSPKMLEHECNVSLQTPSSSDDIQAYALSLDDGATPDTNMKLGQQFAQKVNITCPK